MTGIAIEERAAVRYAGVAVATTIPEIGSAVADALVRVEAHLKEHEVESTGSAIVRYLDADSSESVTIEVGWILGPDVTAESAPVEDPFLVGTVPAGRYVVGHFDGPYAAVGEATEETMQWAQRSDVMLALERTPEGRTAWPAWYESYPAGPTQGPAGPEGPVDICMLTAG